ARDLRKARAAIEAAQAQGPSRSQSAEAGLLLAECAQASGDTGGAVNGYLDVSRRFAELPAADTGLFAAARLEANAGHVSRARLLLHEYLERYPNGRFRNDASARLNALEP